MTSSAFLPEQSVVGSVLIDPRCLPLVLEHISPNDMVLEVDRQIMTAAVQLDRAGTAVDPVTILEHLRAQGLSIGRDYLLQLMDITPTAANVAEYARLAKEHSLRVRTQELIGRLDEQIRGPAGPETVLSAMAEGAEQLQQATAGDVIDPIQAAERFVDHRLRVEGGESEAYVPTTFRDLDAILGGGLLAGGVYIVAARPGMGKTTFALNVADRVAAAGSPVLLVSLEMDVEQIQAKRYARASGVPSDRLLMSQLDDREHQRLAQAMEQVAKLPVTINGGASADVGKIENMARKVRGLRLLVVDYFGLIAPPEGSGRAGRVEYTTEISAQIKALARRLRVPVLLLAQLNREVEKRTDKRPQLSDLRETGAAEQDADGVIFLCRPDCYSTDQDPFAPAETELLVRKNRHGRVGECTLAFNLGTSRVFSADNDPRRAYRRSPGFEQQRMEDMSHEQTAQAR